MRVVSAETVTVPGGTFAATKVIAEGSGNASPPGRNPPSGPALIQVRYDIWYAPNVKRFVKFAAQVYVRGALWSSAVFELTQYSVN
jgi:hypothetical protein